LIILITFDVAYRLRSSSLCSSLHPRIIFSLFGPNIPLSTLFSNTISLYSSLNIRGQVSHPYRTTGKMIAAIFRIIFGTREHRETWGNGSLH
jgi:hypothetical protein